MDTKQLTLFDRRSENCLFADLIESDDDHCFAPANMNGYEVLSESRSDLPTWLASVRGVGFGNISAKPVPELIIPDFISTIPSGSANLLAGSNYEFVAVSLSDVVSPKELLTATDIKQRFGIPLETKVILLNYAKDALIEKIWNERGRIFQEFAKLGFDLVTSINYSIWFDQPHAERLINLKRGLITFEELQNLGIPTIPHVYWYGRKDLDRWIEWLSVNKNVWCIAVNLQTERDYRHNIWAQTMEDLEYLVSNIRSSLRFMVTGASTPERIADLKRIIPNLTLTNGSGARKAACGFVLGENDGRLKYDFTNKIPKNEILNINNDFYISLMRGVSSFNGKQIYP